MTTHFRVFHAPIEIAGQMGSLVKGLREYGHTAIGYNTFHSYLNYDQYIVNTDADAALRVLEETAANYDIFHYHFGCSLQPEYQDLQKLKAMGKKIVMHHWGNDVRVWSRAQQLSPYLEDPCNPWTDAEMASRLSITSSITDTAIVQDYEVYEYVKGYYRNVHVLPLAFDVKNTHPVFPSIDTSPPLVIHAPTQPAFKGTRYIEEVLDHLRRDGFNFQYMRIENMDHQTALGLYRQADIVVDQVGVGSYGTFTVEGMALGKPVLANIRADVRSRFPGKLPVVSADPSTLYANLVEYLRSPDLRYVIGRLGRKYAEQYHELSQVIPQLIRIYESL